MKLMITNKEKYNNMSTKKTSTDLILTSTLKTRLTSNVDSFIPSIYDEKLIKLKEEIKNNLIRDKSFITDFFPENDMVVVVPLLLPKIYEYYDPSANNNDNRSFTEIYNSEVANTSYNIFIRKYFEIRSNNYSIKNNFFEIKLDNIVFPYKLIGMRLFEDIKYTISNNIFNPEMHGEESSNSIHVELLTNSKIQHASCLKFYEYFELKKLREDSIRDIINAVTVVINGAKTMGEIYDIFPELRETIPNLFSKFKCAESKLDSDIKKILDYRKNL